MAGLDFPGAIKDVSASADYLLAHGCKSVGVIGFCMGGALALGSVIRIPSITAGAPFYGVNFQLADPSTLPANKAVEAHFGATDTHKGFSDEATAHKLQAALASSPGAAHAKVVVHPHVGHGFMNSTPAGIKRNERLGNGKHHQEEVDAAWTSVFHFFERHLKK